jgi:Protein of unknown function (DUF1583) C domain
MDMNITGACLLFAIGATGSLESEFYQDFRGKSLDAKLKSFGHDNKKVCQIEPEGLRITLPAKREKTEAVGLTPSFGIAGDFEITLSYELIKAETPNTGYGVGVNIWMMLDSPQEETAKVGHYLRVKEGNTFFADSKLGKEKSKYRMKTRPTDAMTGKLRLARTGATLRCLIAETNNGEFEELLRVEIGAHHVRRVRFAANTGGSPAALDMRLLDLHIRADDLGDAPLLTKPAPISLVYYIAGSIALVMIGAALWRWRSKRASALPLPVKGQG